VAAFYLDNDVAVGIAGALRVLGHTATTARAQQLRYASDGQHFLFATQHNWIMIVHNHLDFLLLHQAWLIWRVAGAGYQLPVHPGILSIPQQR
jgi:hypothetical protein